MTNVMENKLEESHQELQHLRELLKKTQERLGEADNALLYYANTLNYGVLVKGAQSSLVYQNVLKDDFEQSDNDANTVIAGRRARGYFSKYAKD